MKTIYAFIQYKGNSLAVDFPLNIYDMSEHLSSIGICLPANKVTVADTENVSVKLTGLNEVGNAIIERLASSDSLKDINILCRAIEQACVLDYEDMVDRLANSKGRRAKELMSVVEEFTRDHQSQTMGGM